MPGGRPTTYTEEMLNKAKEYINSYSELGDVVPSVVGMCRHINRSKTVVYDWCKEEGKEEFADIVKQISEIQESDLINGGLSGVHNPQIGKMMLAKHGYSDRVEQSHTSPDGSMTPQHPTYTIVKDGGD